MTPPNVKELCERLRERARGANDNAQRGGDDDAPVWMIVAQDYREAAAALEAQAERAERYRAALAELVACCDAVITSPEPVYEQWCARNSAAWDAARAALKGDE